MGTDPTDFDSTLSAGSEAASAISTLAGNDGTGAIKRFCNNAYGSVTEINAALTAMGTDPTTTVR